jgi:hypothetical protein
VDKLLKDPWNPKCFLDDQLIHSGLSSDRCDILKPPQDAGFRALSSVSVQGKEPSVMMNPFQVL